MSMRAFLYAADALRLEEGWSFHVETPGGPQAGPSDTGAKNAQSMQMLTGMMAGVQKKKGARR